MSKILGTFATSLLSLAVLASCSSPASSNPVSEDGFVTIPGGTYTVGCDEEGNGCREVTVETFEIAQVPATIDQLFALNCVTEKMIDRLGSISGQSAYYDNNFIHISEACIDKLNSKDLNYFYRLPELNEMLVVAFGREPVAEHYDEKLRSSLSKQQGGIMNFTDTRPVYDRVQNGFQIYGVLDANKELLFDSTLSEHMIFAPLSSTEYIIRSAPSKRADISAINFRLVRASK